MEQYSFQEASNNSFFSTLLQKKKVLLLIGIGTLILLVLILTLLFFSKDQSLPEEDQIPTVTTTPSDWSFIPPEKRHVVLPKIVKNIYWINNTELAYTYYNRERLRNIIAKTDKNKETILLDSLPLKFSQYFWSNNDSLLIHDFTYPNQIYLLSNSGELEILDLSGYGFSWSTDNRQLFYIDTSSEDIAVPSLYSFVTNTTTPLSLNLDNFTDSLWSNNNIDILLYTNLPDIEESTSYIYNIQTNQVNTLTTQKIYNPSWSPTGEKLAYFTSEGLYVTNREEQTSVLYPMESSPQMTTFTWIDDENVIIVNSTLTKTDIFLLALKTQERRQIMNNLQVQSDQRIELEISPDRKMLALATEKDGLFFIDLQ